MCLPVRASVAETADVWRPRQAKIHAEVLDSKFGAGDVSAFESPDPSGTVSASSAHAGSAQPRRRRRGGGGEQGPVRCSGSGAALDGGGEVQWQCQVSRPGRVVPHQATVSVTERGILLQWNHIEALIGKDSLAEAFLTGKDFLAAENILAVTNEGVDVAGGAGNDDDAADTLCVHVLTTPTPINSPEGQSEYNSYRLFGFEAPWQREVKDCTRAP